MSNMKHTPGPWRACRDGECKCGQIFGDDGNVWVGEIYGPYHLSDGVVGPDTVPPREQQMANARLIAAAPDLLEACQGITPGADEQIAMYGYVTIGIEEFNKICAAIAKATGNSV